MTTQNIILFVALFCAFLIACILTDRYSGPKVAWIVLGAIILSFLSYLFMKRYDYNLAAIAIVVTVFLAVTGGLWALHQDDIQKILHHLDIKPKISCYFEYPIKVEGDKVERTKKNPDIVIKNDGPIEAVSLSADIKIYVYDEQKEMVVQFVDCNFKGFDDVILAQELLPFKDIRQSCIGFNGSNSVAVYSVSVKYYRESNMEPFSLEEHFFTKKREIITAQELKESGKYEKIIEKVKSFVPDEVGSRFDISAATDDIWFVEQNGSFAMKKDADGKLIVQTPEIQGEVSQASYPFLEIKPKRFKSTGAYIEAKIEDNSVKVDIYFEAKNTGDDTANLTEDGFETIATIEPSKSLFTTKTVMAKLKENSVITLDDYLKTINTDDRIFKYRFFAYYRPANHPNELFKVVVYYNIGRDGYDIVTPETGS